MAVSTAGVTFMLLLVSTRTNLHTQRKQLLSYVKRARRAIQQTSRLAEAANRSFTDADHTLQDGRCTCTPDVPSHQAGSSGVNRFWSSPLSSLTLEQRGVHRPPYTIWRNSI